MKKQNVILLLLMMLIFASCGKKEEASTKKIAGADSKVWKANKELNREGDKEKLTKAEKQEELRFYSNGTFTVHGETDHQEGKWTYKDEDKTLSLQFNNEEDISENFKVLELENDKMKLQSPDGSQMILESE